MEGILLGHEAIEAVADEVYTTLGIRGEGAVEQPYEEFLRLRYAYFAEHLPQVDADEVIVWALAEATADCQNPTNPAAGLPWLICSKVLVPALGCAYESGILIGVALARRLAEQAPEAL